METLAIDGFALGDRHGAERTTVVRALHGDDILLPGDHTRHLDSSLDGFRSRVPEEERV